MEKIKEICDMPIDDWHKYWLIMKCVLDNYSADLASFFGPLGSKESFELRRNK